MVYFKIFTQIAMKSSNEQLLHLIENMMRKQKPSHLTPNTPQSSHASDSNTYENCGSKSSNRIGSDLQSVSQSERVSVTEVSVLLQCI